MPKETILILDRERYSQWILKTLLENEKYIVVAVDSFERTWKDFSEFKVSGLITEYWLDHSSTIETIRKLKEIFPELYVMMLTDKELDEEEYEEIIDAGVDDYFLKPLSGEKILLHLRKGLRQRNISLQKKRLEQELNRIQTKAEVQYSTS
jgi:DNA-binding response OmpR family regulator